MINIEIIKNFAEYQERAMKLAFYPNRRAMGIKVSDRLSYPTLKLCGEAGEVAEKVGKLIRDGLPLEKSEGIWQTELLKELGDVLWYITAIATELGLNLEDVASLNIEKLESRANRGKLGGSGDDR